MAQSGRLGSQTDFVLNAGSAASCSVNSSFLSYRVSLGSDPNPSVPPPHKLLGKPLFLIPHLS